MDDVTREFVVESGENLDQIERELLNLEKNPGSREIVASIFRFMHTIKGTCGFFGFNRLQSVTHSAESMLASLRDGKIVFNPALATAMLSTIDAIRKMLANIEKEGVEGETDVAPLVQTLTELKDAGAKPAAPAPPPPAPAPPPPPPPRPAPEARRPEAKPKSGASALESVGEELPADIDEVMKEFVTESRESLEQLEKELLVLEQTPAAPESLKTIFRYMHSIKGTCGFFGFSRLEALTQAAETVLGRLRDGKITFSADLASIILAVIDAIRRILAVVETRGIEGELDCTDLLQVLATLKEGATARKVAPSAPAKAAPEPAPAKPPPAPAPAPPPPPAPTPAAARAEEPVEVGADNGGARTGNAADESIRVDVGILDKLMNMVGELVLVRNQFTQLGSTRRDPVLQKSCQRLNLVTAELQEGVMKTRMQPIGNLWSKFPRLVRDLGLATGKQVSITMQGSDTDLDRTILESMRDPLTHLVRNAVDHGIELPAVRLAAGKPQEGRIRMHAFHESGQINIEVSDDGGGIDHEKIRLKALERSMFSEAQMGRMSTRELIDLIFLPGFTTADRITEISGRGVGMDVVKMNIERLGGTVDILTRVGGGTTFKIKIPLTLAIIPALIVTTAGDRYAIPQVSLVELVRLEGERARSAIEMVYGAPVYRLRGQLLPIVRLSRELMLESEAPAEGSRDGRALNIVVLQAGERQFGLVVDRINDSEEIVVKPLGRHVKGIPCFAGATILGDGRVALILDILGLAQSANVISEVRERAMDKPAPVHQEQIAMQSLLICKGMDDGRMAVPLAQVARLEEFSVHILERTGHREVVQYRDRIMPIIRVSEVLPERRSAPREGEPATISETVSVVVYTHKDRSVGLVVKSIMDIVEAPVTVQRPASREGVLGCQVIQGRVTELLDVPGIIRKLAPDFFEGAGAPK